MGNELGNLEPPKLFGRKKGAAPKPAAVEESTEPDRQPESPRPPRQPRRPRPSRVRRRVRLSATVAAVIAGTAAGVVLSGLTWAAETASDPGDSNRLNAVILVAIFVLSVVVGAIILRLLDVPSPGTIAFLGTALVAVIGVVAFSSHFDDAVGAVGGVVLSAVAYAISRWVTDRYIDE